MEKNKFLTPIIVVVAVLVIVGGYFAWQRYQRERAVRQLVGGLENAFAGKNVGDLAKLAEEASKIAEESGITEEAGQTDPYGEAEEITTGNALVEKANSEIKPMLEEIFGGAKLTYYLSNVIGNDENSGSVVFTVKRPFGSGDAAKFTETIKSGGYQIVTSSQSDGGLSVLANKNGGQYTFGAEKDGQEITIVIFSSAVFGGSQ